MLIRDVGELIRDKQLHGTVGSATIHEACLALSRHRVGALAVLRERALVGILSERDVITRVVAQDREPRLTLVQDVMTPDPQTIDVSTGLADALARMIEGHFRHLPVLDPDGALIGMISIRDIPTEYRYLYQRYRQALDEPPSEGPVPSAGPDAPEAGSVATETERAMAKAAIWPNLPP